MRVVKPKIRNSIDEEVAVLLPMRNEEENVVASLTSVLGSQGITHISIKVLDDGSADKTALLAKSLPGIEVITGKELPEGWLGKNFACHQLAESTSADYLVFLDADVRLVAHLGREVGDLLRECLTTLLDVHLGWVSVTRGEPGWGQGATRAFRSSARP